MPIMLSKRECQVWERCFNTICRKQNQHAFIWKLEIQIGQLALQQFDRTSKTLPSNIVRNPKEHVQEITMKSWVQLPEIHEKRPDKKDKQLVIEEEGVEKQSAQSQEGDVKEYVESSKAKTLVLIKAYVSPIFFLRCYKSTSLTNSL
ncbi:Uncharacterized protein Adt_05860 [Abeliophyllum distichum]|uniref:Uncharacterized protein n=1 Tax=Abeliophyllum distichum TaxID=126358 RepID=A0ABD1V598_9LAMI